jgi:CubicO group peptidase (beta-lactamase class C family)
MMSEAQNHSLSQRASVSTIGNIGHPESGSIAQALQPFIDSGVLPGAVTGVANRERILSLEAIGYADLARGVKMEPDSLFWVASQTKPITATAVMMMVDEGKLRLDDPITEYLPEFKEQWVAVERDDQHILLKKPSTPITLRHLLCHCSGLPFSTLIEQPTLDGLPLRDAVRSYAMVPLQWEPGTKLSYSNAGTNTAARILEIVSGVSYADFLSQRILEPLGMTDTTFWPSDQQLQRLATPYKPNANKTALEELTISQLRYPLSDRRRHPMPAGGLFATTGDMLRFCQMHLNRGVFGGRRYISEESWTQMTTKQTPPQAPDKCGLGWWPDAGVFGHGGAFATHMSVDTNRGLVLIYHVQLSGLLGNADQAHAAFKQTAEKLFSV